MKNIYNVELRSPEDIFIYKVFVAAYNVETAMLDAIDAYFQYCCKIKEQPSDIAFRYCRITESGKIEIPFFIMDAYYVDKDKVGDPQ